MVELIFGGGVHGMPPRILLRLRCHLLDRWNHPFQTLYWADIRVSLYSGGKTRY